MKISIVVPTLNSERTIEKCLLSLSKQTYPPYEIIVVDGKSTDSTVEIVEGFNDAKLIIKQGSQGSARNEGAETADGDIIFFCDSDCILDHRALEYNIRVYERIEDVVGVMGSMRRAGTRNIISDFMQKQFMVFYWLGNLQRDGTISSKFSSANFSIKKYCFHKYRFREDLISSEDTELFIRLKKKGLKIFFEPRAVVYHHHPTTIEQLFRKYMWYGEGIFQIDKIHRKDFRDRFQIFSPARYINFPESYLREAVFLNNRLLCNGCALGPIQKCKIRSSQLMKKKIVKYVNLHRVTCLAIATGILKQRTGIDYLSTRL